MPVILFPSQPFTPREIDPDFAAGRLAARAAGLGTALVDHTRIVEGAAAAGVTGVPDGEPLAFYHELAPDFFERIATALALEGTS